jgi:hypothetical protein
MLRKSDKSLSSIGVLFLAVGTFGAFTTATMAQPQFHLDLDNRLIGNWLQEGTGTTIEFKDNGRVNVGFEGGNAHYSGQGSIEKCTTAGANLCVRLQTLQCNLLYQFSDDRNITLSYHGGGVPCPDLKGSYKKTSS